MVTVALLCPLVAACGTRSVICVECAGLVLNLLTGGQTGVLCHSDTWWSVGCTAQLLHFLCVTCWLEGDHMTDGLSLCLSFRRSSAFPEEAACKYPSSPLSPDQSEPGLVSGVTDMYSVRGVKTLCLLFVILTMALSKERLGDQ